ncbi:DUF2975 domain-containing protein [Stackebrandtia nassauensis]|uniref:DUF2975 domain-containing protein n=1 Tax=Stackebrandtia nassauensis (strain DSM 44728 / CIP 108903 / NRRL B-16338 / NBRC 102104 / LLR-40K-21) TaxID=446470 RepID=D3Q3Y1_STANL|nr:DUF2975 domain-containing protein [Stackebrandtia nassauensis]ADD44048.1 hypothetical protein Snas_4402 [Stackebrandtia nassauensis DSM 44728]
MLANKRTDWLREFQTGMAVATVVMALVTLGVLAVGVVGLTGGTNAGTVQVRVPGTVADQPVITATEGLSDRAAVAADGGIDVVITDPTLGEYGLSLLTWLPGYCLIMVVTGMLFTMIRRARRTDPFTAATVTTLRRLGSVALIGGVAVQLAAMLANYALSGSVLASGTAGAFDYFPWGWVLGGLAAYTVADIMARGRRMREDLDGVI